MGWHCNYHIKDWSGGKALIKHSLMSCFKKRSSLNVSHFSYFVWPEIVHFKRVSHRTGFLIALFWNTWRSLYASNKAPRSVWNLLSLSSITFWNPTSKNHFFILLRPPLVLCRLTCITTDFNITKRARLKSVFAYLLHWPGQTNKRHKVNRLWLKTVYFSGVVSLQIRIWS